MSNPYRMERAGLTQKQQDRLFDVVEKMVARGDSDPETFACPICNDGTAMSLDEKFQAWQPQHGTRCQQCINRLQIARVKAQHEHREIPL